MKLRKLEDKDIDGILDWMQDKEINRNFRFNGNLANRTSIKKFIKESKNESFNLHRAVVDNEDNYLGTVSLKEIDDKAKNAEYAISLRAIAQGTGAAKFATDEILKLGFKKLDLKRVYLNVLSENLKANRFYEKYGFVYEGEFVKHINIRGELKNLKWYRILKEEYMMLTEIML